MDQQLVSRLEREIEDAVAEVIANTGRGQLPLVPTPQTMHLMAKAAVTVYEAAVEARVEGH